MTDIYEDHMHKLLGFVFGPHAELEVKPSTNRRMRLVGNVLVDRHTLASWKNRSWLEIDDDGDRAWARLSDEGARVAGEDWR